MDQAIRILFLAADPTDKSRIRLAEEFQRIKDELRRGQFASRFVLEEEMSVKTEDMTRAILNFRPHVVHFSGHGSVDGELCFEDAKGETQRVAPGSLEDFFSLVSEEVDCVVLNACYAEAQARVISKYIPYVVGMKKEIKDESAIRFSLGFYQALSSGRSLPEAFKNGCTLIRANIEGPLEPVLMEGPGAHKRLTGSWGGQTGKGSSGAPKDFDFPASEGSVDFEGDVTGDDITAIGNLDEGSRDAKRNVSGKVRIGGDAGGRHNMFIGTFRR